VPKGSLAASGETLGRRKSLGRTATGDILDRVLLDPHPDVIKSAMYNPRLKEEQVVRLAGRTETDAVILTVIAESRFGVRASVKRALAKNPATPPTTACRVMASLTRAELLEVAHDARLADEVRDTARALIEAKPPRLLDLG
jgi:hypothetical protein